MHFFFFYTAIQGHPTPPQPTTAKNIVQSSHSRAHKNSTPTECHPCIVGVGQKRTPACPGPLPAFATLAPLTADVQRRADHPRGRVLQQRSGGVSVQQRPRRRWRALASGLPDANRKRLSECPWDKSQAPPTTATETVP